MDKLDMITKASDTICIECTVTDGTICDGCMVRKIYDRIWNENQSAAVSDEKEPMISYTFEDIRIACGKELTDEQCRTIVDNWDYSDLWETVRIVAASYGFID